MFYVLWCSLLVFLSERHPMKTGDNRAVSYTLVATWKQNSIKSHLLFFGGRFEFAFCMTQNHAICQADRQQIAKLFIYVLKEKENTVLDRLTWYSENMAFMTVRGRNRGQNG